MHYNESCNYAPGRGKKGLDGINATEKLHLRVKMKLIGKLASNNTSKIGMLPSASKDI